MRNNRMLSAKLWGSASVLAVGLGFGTALAGDAAVPTELYIEKAAITDMFEVEAGKVAAQRATNEEVRQFGQEMAEDHADTSSKLKEALADAGTNTTVPTQLDSEHQAKLDQLKAASGAEFDQLYVDTQLKGHEEALALHEGYSQGGENEKLKELAADTASVVSEHLEEIQNISANIK